MLFGSHGPITPSSSTSGFADSTLSTFPFELGGFTTPPPTSFPSKSGVPLDVVSAKYFIEFASVIDEKFIKVHNTPKINALFTISPSFILIFNSYYQFSH